MVTLTPENGGSSLNKKTFTKKVFDSYPETKVAELFKDDPEGLSAFNEGKKSDPLGAAILLLEKVKQHPGTKKGEQNKLKKQLADAQTLLSKEMAVLRAEEDRRNAKKPTPKKEEEVVTPVIKTVTETPVVETPEKSATTTTAPESRDEILRQMHILEIAKARGTDPVEYKNLSKEEIAKLHKEVREAAQVQQQDITTARRFLTNKLPKNEIDTLSQTPDELLAKASELAEQTLGIKTLTEVKEYLNTRSETAREIDKRLTPEKIAMVKDILNRKDLPIVTHQNPDLDAKIAMYLVKTIGEAQSEITDTSIKKGAEYSGKGIVLDVSGIKDILDIQPDRWVSDHHFENKWIKTSTSEIVLETLRRSGKAEKIEAWAENLISFVTDVDNMSYPRQGKEWYKQSYSKTILGLRDILSTESLVELFKAGKSPYETLTDEELARPCTDKQGNSKTLGQLVTTIQGYTDKNIRNVERYERRAYLSGQKTFSPEFGKVLVYESMPDKKDWEIPGGSHAAYNMGYDLYIRYQPDEKFYFVSAPNKELADLATRLGKKDSYVKIVRGSMIRSQKPETDTTAGPGLTENQIMNYLGLTIPPKAKVVKDVEYSTYRAVITEQRSLHTGRERLATIRTFLENQARQAKENIAGFEGSLAETQTKLDSATSDGEKREYAAKIGFLTSRIESLKEEQKLWEDKLKTAVSITATDRKSLNTLFDQAKLKGLSVEQNTTVTETLIQESVERTPEQIKEKLEEVTAEFDAVEAKLKQPGGTVPELRELLLAHYNLSRLGFYLQEGAVGEQPKELTWAEFKPIFIEKHAARKSALTEELAAEVTPEEVFEVAPETPKPEKEIAITIEGMSGEKEVTVAKVYVKEGDYVTAGTPIAEIESDKMSTDVRAPSDGYVSFKESAGVVTEGAILNNGGTFATISSKKPESVAKSSKPEIPKIETAKQNPEELLPANQKNETTSVTEMSRLEMASFVRAALRKELAETIGNDNIKEITLGDISVDGTGKLLLKINQGGKVFDVEGTVATIGAGKDTFEVNLKEMVLTNTTGATETITNLVKSIWGQSTNEKELVKIMNKNLTQALNKTFKAGYPRVEKVKLTR